MLTLQWTSIPSTGREGKGVAGQALVHPLRPRGSYWGRGKVYTGEKKIMTFLRQFFFRPYRLFPAPTNCPWVFKDGSGGMGRLADTDFNMGYALSVFTES